MDFPMQGECPDGMACETKRGYSQLKHCFTNFCLLLFKKKKKKKQQCLASAEEKLIFSPRSKHQHDLLLFFPSFLLLTQKSIPCGSRTLATNL